MQPLQSENSPAQFWDAVERFQGSHLNTSPNKEAGLKGLKTIRRILEPHWVISSIRHPLWNNFWVAYERNYLWFFQCAKILEEATKVPGSEQVIPRLGIPEEYANAFSELDFALRFDLSGIPCRFVPRASTPTPDLMIEHGNKKTLIEITSLNSSEQDRIELETMNWLLYQQSRYHCYGGGSLYLDDPNPSDLSEQIRQTAEDAFREALDSNGLSHRNIRGVFDFYVAPHARADLVPEKWRGHFQVSSRTPLPVKDKLARKIDCKTDRQLNSDEASILAIYDRIISSEVFTQLSKDHDLAVKVATLPNLAAVVLIHTITHPFAVNNIEPKTETEWDLVSISHKLPNGEAEEILTWENSEEKGHSDTIRLLNECLTGFPLNLARLFER